jgi:hypothetical protein
MKSLFENWRKYLLNEDELIHKWAQATGIPEKRLREGISRRDFLRGVGSVALSGLGTSAEAGETGDTGQDEDQWVPSDDDSRWGPSDWTGLEGFAVIDTELVELDDLIQGGAFSVSEYKERLKTWRTKDLGDALIGQRATIVHGDPRSGQGLGLERYKVKDNTGLYGKLKLPISWSLMFDEWAGRND